MGRQGGLQYKVEQAGQPEKWQAREKGVPDLGHAPALTRAPSSACKSPSQSRTALFLFNHELRHS